MNELWTAFATIIGAWAAAVVLPGPNFLATAHTACTRSRRLGLMVSLGVAFGTLIWAVAALSGLGLVFKTAAWAYQIVKYVGAAYLLFVGVRMLFAPGANKSSEAVDVRTAHTPGRAFRYGLVVDLSNPKAAVFFTSLFAVTVPPASPFWYKSLIIFVVVGISSGWYAFVACAVGYAPVAEKLRRSQRLVSRFTGAVFVALGLKLASQK
jgi:RhtB (resistance to homoserine/threonine) family protein